MQGQRSGAIALCIPRSGRMTIRRSEAEKVTRHHGVLVSDDAIIRSVTVQRAHTKRFRLGTDDSRAFAPNAVDADPRRQLRIVDIERRRLILEIEHDAVAESGAADDAQRFVGVRAPDAFDLWTTARKSLPLSRCSLACAHSRRELRR